MGLEAASYLSDLVETNPLSGDARSVGDDHLRLLKAVLKTTFPGFGGVFHRTQEKSVSYSVVTGDNCTVIICTAALTLNLPAAAVVGSGFNFGIYALGGDVIVDGYSAELVNGAATKTLVTGSVDWIFTDGTAWELEKMNKVITRPTLDNPTVQGTAAVPDLLRIQADGAATKEFGFDASAVTAGQYRKMTVPDQDFTPTAQGRQTASIPAGAWTPRLTAGASVSLTAVGDVIARTLDFSTTVYAQFIMQIPKSWNAGTLKAKVHWFSASNDAVVWVVRGRVLEKDVAVSQTLTGNSGVTSSNGTSEPNRLRETAEFTVVVQGTPAKDRLLLLEVFRDEAAGPDTLVGIAKMWSVTLYYDTNGVNDA